MARFGGALSSGAARLASVLSATMLAATSVLSVPTASANHAIMVEGNCLGPDKEQVEPGTCGDHDGDGRVGTLEDNDGADQVFGTINAALGAANQGVNQNGRVTIVTSGIFLEQVVITGAMGNVSLEAAPGVDANIEAVRGGDAQGNANRQAVPGVIIDAPNTRQINIRNIMVRNWTEGIQIKGNSRVTLDGVRLENNRDYGIHVMDSARASITNSQVNASGFRSGATSASVDNTPNPGNGIEFEDQATGLIAFTAVTGSFGAGIKNNVARNRNAVDLFQVVAFDNNPNFVGVRTTGGSGPGSRSEDDE